MICVGSIGADYTRPTDEGYGPRVAFLAPGEKVTTVNYAPEDADHGELFKEVTGASPAAAHVAGVAALFRSWKGRDYGSIRPLLEKNSLLDVCNNVPYGQPNRLINSGILRQGYQAAEPFIDAGVQPFFAQDCNDISGGAGNDPHAVGRRIPDEL